MKKKNTHTRKYGNYPERQEFKSWFATDRNAWVNFHCLRRYTFKNK